MDTAPTTVLPVSTLVTRQRRKLGPKMIGENTRMTVNVRYDDDCKNGHNTFSVTCDLHEKNGRGIWEDIGGGCMHEEIVKHFPEVAHLIKWHLVSSDGPHAYIPNTLYFASDKDYNDRRAGEVSSTATALKFGNSPISYKIGRKFWKWLKEKREDRDFELMINKIEHKKDNYKFDPKYTLNDFCTEWHECPFDNQLEAVEFLDAWRTLDVFFLEVPTAWSEGKAREFDNARAAAVWPDATDEELSSPDLKQKLVERLPALMEQFRADMIAFGFEY